MYYWEKCQEAAPVAAKDIVESWTPRERNLAQHVKELCMEHCPHLPPDADAEEELQFIGLWREYLNDAILTVLENLLCLEWGVE